MYKRRAIYLTKKKLQKLWHILEEEVAVFVSMIICKENTFSIFENVDYHLIWPSKLYKTVFIIVLKSKYQKKEYIDFDFKDFAFKKWMNIQCVLK